MRIDFGVPLRGGGLRAGLHSWARRVLLMTPSSGFLIFLVSSVAGADVSALVAEAQDLNLGHREATLSLWPTLLLGGLAGRFG